MKTVTLELSARELKALFASMGAAMTIIGPPPARYADICAPMLKPWSDNEGYTSEVTLDTAAFFKVGVMIALEMIKQDRVSDATALAIHVEILGHKLDAAIMNLKD